MAESMSTIDLRDRAATLRQAAPDAKRLPWRHLRNRQLNGSKFRRQEVIGSHIVDFVCLETKLVIEADGG